MFCTLLTIQLFFFLLFLDFLALFVLFHPMLALFHDGFHYPICFIAQFVVYSHLFNKCSCTSKKM